MPHRTSNQAAYDQLPYQNCIVPQIHPDHLATMGILNGMTPPPSQACRVLELGCADGANLIAIAQTLPESQFLGIDFAEAPISQGRSVIAATQLKNISLSQEDILQVDFGDVRFDYIIAHGMYSWVTPAIRKRIFEIFKKHLSLHGLCFLSYNTLPGWTMQGAFRKMMLHHIRFSSDPSSRVTKAREFLDFLASSWSESGDPQHPFLREFNDTVRSMPDFYLAHDALEETNDPVYFHEIATQAAQHDLQFVSEAASLGHLEDLPQNMAIRLVEMAGNDMIQIEQYLDFLNNRKFRSSLFCHSEVALRRTTPGESLQRLHISTKARLDSSRVEIPGETTVSFQTFEGLHHSTEHPICKAAFEYLIQIQPRTVPFPILFSEARSRTQPNETSNSSTDESILRTELLRAHRKSHGFIKLQTSPRRIPTAPSKCPLASPLARYMAQHQATVINLQLEHITLGRLNRHLVQLLDGTRDIPTLQLAIEEWIRSGSLGIPDSDEVIHEGVHENLEHTLHAFADQSILME